MGDSTGSLLVKMNTELINDCSQETTFTKTTWKRKQLLTRIFMASIVIVTIIITIVIYTSPKEPETVLMDTNQTKCDGNFAGINCLECKSGIFGHDCSKSCMCDIFGSDALNCNKTNGQCECFSWVGAQG